MATLILVQIFLVAHWCLVDAPTAPVAVILVLFFVVLWGLPLGVFFVLKRSRCQFTLSTLLATIVLLSLLLSGWSVLDRKDLARRGALARISQLRGDYIQEYSGPEWLQRYIGDGDLPYFSTVTGVILDSTMASDEDIEFLARSVEDVNLFLVYNSAVTNRSVQSLSRLAELRCLALAGTNVDDEGVVHLRRLTKLADVNLSNTQITDAGVANIVSAGRIQHLNLAGTSVSDNCVPQLARLRGVVEIDLRSTNVSKDGIARLRRVFPKALLKGGK